MTGRNRTRTRVAAMLIASAALLSAMGLRAGDKDDIVLTLRDKVIGDLSSKGLTLSFRVGILNPAQTPRDLVRYRYRVTVNQREFLDMDVELPQPLSAPGGQETLIALPVKITYDLLYAAVGPVEERASCDVVGDMYFLNERRRRERVPFALTGEFPIFKDPDIDVLPLKVNDLTVGGADVVFNARFRNLNAYELLVDRIGFRIFLAGLEVHAGEVPDDKSLPGSGNKTFSLPFLIDFFEAGEAMRQAFGRAEVDCRFEGEIEIASAWGRLKIRFDRPLALPLEKTALF